MNEVIARLEAAEVNGTLATIIVRDGGHMEDWEYILKNIGSYFDVMIYVHRYKNIQAVNF